MSNARRAAERDDRILPAMVAVLAPLAILSSIFGPILFLLPGETETLFVWTIEPEMSAVFIGAGYIFGALAIWHLLWLGKWHPLGVALTGTWAFSAAMLTATLLHWDRFHQGTILFWGWLLVYIITPLLTPVLYAINRRRDPGLQPGDRLVPRQVRPVLLAVGAFYVALGLLMFFAPTALADLWPWRLTPLVSRVMGGWLLLFGVGAALAWVEPRWSAFRPLVIDASVWLALLLVGSLLHTADFDFGEPTAVLWFVAVAGALAGTIGFYLFNERSARPAPMQEAERVGAA